MKLDFLLKCMTTTAIQFKFHTSLYIFLNSVDFYNKSKIQFMKNYDFLNIYIFISFIT